MKRCVQSGIALLVNFVCHLICYSCFATLIPEQILIDVKSGDTLDPLSNVDATMVVSFGQRRQVTELNPSGLGRFSVSLPGGKWTDLHLHVSVDGYVFQEIHWTPANVPDHFLFLLEPGIEIGGKVIDFNGNLLKGAKMGIRLSHHSGESELLPIMDDPLIHWETTDQNGNWTCSHVPDDAVPIQFIVKYPKLGPSRYYTSIKDALFKADQLAKFGDLKGRRAVFMVKESASLKGLVVDPNGDPLAGVKVTGGPYPTWTNSQGKFLIRNQKEQPLKILLQSNGFQSLLKSLNDEISSEPHVIVMQPVDPAVVEFKNEEGESVEGVFISNSRWQDVQIKDWRWYSNEEGKVFWSGGSDAPAEFEVFHPDYVGQSNVRLVPGEKNQIVLKSVPEFKLHVIDQSSGSGVQNLSVQAGHPHEDGIHWVSYHELSHEEGHYLIPIRDLALNQFISLEADHYSRLILRLPATGVEDRQLVVRMKPLHRLTGKVVGRDGLPLAGAEIVGSSALARPVLGRFRIVESPLGEIGISQDDGSFTMQTREMPSHVMAIHRTGVAIVTWEEFKTDSVLTLEPWGSLRIENRWSGDIPMQGIFALDSFPSYPLQFYANAFHQQMAPERDFIFDSVPPGVFLFGHMKEGSMSHAQVVEHFSEKKSHEILSMGSGAVKGVIRLPETLKGAPSGHVDGWLVRYPLDSGMNRDLPKYAREFLKQKGFRYTLEIDQHLEASASRLPPGQYWIELYYHKGPHQDDNKSFQSIFKKQIQIESNITIDLGDLITSID